MEVQLINQELLSELHEKARENERLRMNYDLRTTPEDTSQRMLNVLEPGTRVPIHRHMKTSETVICIEGCMDEVFYEEIQGDADKPAHNGEKALDESAFVEVARHRLFLANKNTGFRYQRVHGTLSRFLSLQQSLRLKIRHTVHSCIYHKE